MSEKVQRAKNRVGMHLVHLDPVSDPIEEGDRELPAEMLAELRETVEQAGALAGTAEPERDVPERQTQPSEQREDTIAGRLVEKAELGGVAGVERHADRDRLAVPQA